MITIVCRFTITLQLNDDISCVLITYIHRKKERKAGKEIKFDQTQL